MSSSPLTKNRISLAGDQLLQTPKKGTAAEHPVLSPSKEKENEPRAPVTHELATGHQVEIDLDGQEIRVDDPKGDVLVRIYLEASGPTVELQGAKLQLRSTESVDVNCADFKVNAEQDIHLNAGAQLTVESTQELHLNCETDVRIRGKVIWLN
jgi:hypothetical protein